MPAIRDIVALKIAPTLLREVQSMDLPNPMGSEPPSTYSGGFLGVKMPLSMEFARVYTLNFLFHTKKNLKHPTLKFSGYTPAHLRNFITWYFFFK